MLICASCLSFIVVCPTVLWQILCNVIVIGLLTCGHFVVESDGVSPLVDDLPSRLLCGYALTSKSLYRRCGCSEGGGVMPLSLFSGDCFVAVLAERLVDAFNTTMVISSL